MPAVDGTTEEEIKKSKDAAKGENEQKSDAPPSVPFFQLFRYADKLDIALMCLGIIFGVAYGILMPLLCIFLGDALSALTSWDFVKNIGLLTDEFKDDVKNKTLNVVYTLIGFGFATMVSAYGMQACWMVAGERQTRCARRRFLQSALLQDLSWFESNRPGELVTKLTSDALLFQNGISEKLGQIVGYGVQFFAGFVIAFFKQWKLAIILIATVPLFMITGGVVGKVIAAGTTASQSAYGKAGAVALECLSQIRTVSAYGGQARSLKAYSSLLVDVVKVNERKAWVTGLSFGIFFGLLYGLFALGFYVGSLIRLNVSDFFSVPSEDQTKVVGQVVTVLFAVVTGAFSIINIGPSAQSIAKALAAAPRLFEVDDSKPTIKSGNKILFGSSENAGEKKSDSSPTGKIKFDNVSFSYPLRPKTTVLDSVTLEIEPGQTVALVGASGSGKSTIIQLLERFYDCTSGNITIDGTSISEFEVASIRRHMSLVGQEPVLFDASVADNVRLGANDPKKVTQAEIEAACRLSNAHEFVSALPKGYETRVGERGSMLSGGQKQRVAIARALIKNPRILLLDEASAALDSESERIVQDALDRASAGRTTLMIAHRLATVKNAHKIVVMQKGKIVEVGTHESLIAENGVYAGLVHAQELKRLKAPLSPEGGNASQNTEDDVESDKEEEEEDELADGNQAAVEGAEKPVAGAGGSISPLQKDRRLSAASAQMFQSKEDEEEQEAKKIEAILKGKKMAWGRILGMQKPEWPLLCVGLVVGIANGVMLPAFGILLGLMISVFGETDEKMKEGVELYCLIFLGLMFANVVFSLLQFGCFGVAGERLTKRVREQMFRAFLRQETAYFDNAENSTGVLTARLSEQAEHIQGLTGPNAANLLQICSSLVASIIASFYYSWQVSLVILATIPFLVIGSVFEASVMKGESGKTRLAYSSAAQTACEALQSIATVKSLNLEKRVQDDYARKINVPFKSGVRRALIASWGFGFSQAVPFWVYAIALVTGLEFLLNNILSTSGDFFKALYTLMFGSIAFGQAATYGPNIKKGKVAALQLFELEDRIPPIDSYSEAGAKPVDISGKVQMDQGQFSYPQRQDAMVLRDMSVSVAPGKMLALVGPSGSGKSTIVALLQRLYDLNNGILTLDDSDVKSWHLGYLRQNLAIVAQEPSLFSCSIRDNISYGLPDGEREAVTDARIKEVARMANIEEFVEALPQKYDTNISSSQLSGGQKQRISIARALIRNPRLLLCDEATSALDSASERVVQAALEDAARGRTSIVIAHRLATVQHADCIAVVKNGTVVESGTHEELLAKRGLYAKLAARQMLTVDSAAATTQQ